MRAAPVYTLCEVAGASGGGVRNRTKLAGAAPDADTARPNRGEPTAMQPPPCVIPGQPLNHCARSVYALEICTTYDLGGVWLGWKLRGAELVSPGRERIGPDRLAHLMHMAALGSLAAAVL